MTFINVAEDVSTTFTIIGLQLLLDIEIGMIV